MVAPRAKHYFAALGTAVLRWGKGVVIPAPVAEFIGTPTSGVVPMAVTMTDQSTGSITTRSWVVRRDGVVTHTSAASNPTFALTVAGVYSFELTVTGPGGSSTRTRSSYVTASAAPPGTQFASFTLTAPTAGTHPYAVGHVFRQGDFPAGATLDGVQATVKSTWPDGSARIAILAGLASLSANTPATVSLRTGTPPAGAALTTTDLKATGVAAAVDAGAFGSASWSGADWDTPFETWVSGPVMSSWLYRKPIGSDAHLVAWLEVRLWSSGAVEVLPWVENGYMRVAAPGERSATFAFTLGGTQRFSAPIVLPHHARTPLVSGATLSHWLASDPGVTWRHDPAYMRLTRLVPNVVAEVTNLAPYGLPSSYTPLQLGNYTGNMGATGYQAAIGLLPLWDALYLSNTDPAVLAGLQRNAYSAGRWGIYYREEATNRPARFSANPNFSTNSSSTGDLPPAATGTAPGGWDVPHHPSMGYMAYLVTGRYFHMETLQFTAIFNGLNQPNYVRGGASAIFDSTSGASTTRGAAWAIRTLVQAAIATPDDNPLASELRASLAANIDWNHARYVAQPNNPLGFVAGYYASDDGPNGKFQERVWMQDFYTAAFGYALAVDPPVTSTVKERLSAFFAWKAKSIIGRLGGTGATEWLYRDAAVYNGYIAPADAPDWAGGTGPWYANFGEAYADTFGTANPGVAGDLRGGNFPEMTSYWGNLLPAIAYAVEHEVTGAEAAYNRMAGAGNYSALSANFPTAPQWGVTPIRGLLPAWVSALPLMQWYEIPNTRLSDTPPSPIPLGILGPKGKVEAWNGATLKREGSVYMLGAAGGHRDYGGNEVNALALNTATPRWVELRAPTPNNLILSDGNNGTQWYADKRPSTTHTYHATQFINSLNRMMVFNSPGYNGPGGQWPPPNTPPWTLTGLSFSFNLATMDWDDPEYVAAFPGSGDFTSCLCVKHPLTDDVYYSMNYGDGWWRWNAASNTWTKLAGSGRNPWFSGAAIDPIRSRMLIVGGYGSTPCEVRNLSGIPQAVTFGGIGRSLLDACQHYDTCVYDEALDCFWVLSIVKDGNGAGVGTRLLKVTASDLVVSQPVTTGTPPGPRLNGIHNSFQYVPELRGVVIQDSYTGNVKFMRTAL